jgi:hypothetical protein
LTRIRAGRDAPLGRVCCGPGQAALETRLDLAAGRRFKTAMSQDQRPQDQVASTTGPDDSAPAKKLSPAAERALAEAAARRAERARAAAQSPKEVAGRGGLDPARYGDWEVKGVASDF